MRISVYFYSVLMTLAIASTALGLQRFASINAVVLDSSNLPIIVIDTESNTIVDEPKITARMKVINHAEGIFNKPGDADVEYDGYIGIEIRGHYSASLPQKPYGMETRDSAGNNINVSLLGMPDENDWILLANYNDKTFMRNTLAFDLFTKMGHYATRARLCEVILNGEYQGIYVLTENIKQDKNRINISNLTSVDTAGIDLTGGYIFEINYPDGSNSDGWESKYGAIDRPTRRPYFIYRYPKADEILNQQKEYLQRFVGIIDSMLRSPQWADPNSGYRSCIDATSFIDYFIIGEVSRNVDAYKKSAYFYKDKDIIDGKLHAGPVWDFDWAWKNINECMVDGIDGSGWTYLISSVCRSTPTPPGWVVKMLEDTVFTGELYNRYTSLRTTLLSEENINSYADSIYNLVYDAQKRHFQKWPILGINVGTPEVDEQPDSYDGEIAKFKKWISTRLTWLDENMPGKDIVQGVNEERRSIQRQTFALQQNYPNPFNPATIIAYHLPSDGHVSLKVYNLLGQEVATMVNEVKTAGRYSVPFSGAGLASGVYIYTISASTFMERKKMVLMK